eukprot:11207054-Lingulodinium_polyedra.AAC.1
MRASTGENDSGFSDFGMFFKHPRTGQQDPGQGRLRGICHYCSASRVCPDCYIEAVSSQEVAQTSLAAEGLAE